MITKIKNKIASLSKKTKIITSIIIAILLCGSITLAVLLPPSMSSVYEKAVNLATFYDLDYYDLTNFVRAEYDIDIYGYVHSVAFKELREKRSSEVLTRLKIREDW